MYLCNFLSERHLHIKDESNQNNYFVRHTDKGLAQGDPISPLLFNIITIRCFQGLFNNVNMCQYADDFVLFITSNNLIQCKYDMQAALYSFCDVMREVGLEVSATKSKVCIFSRGFKKLNIDLKLHNCRLDLVDSYKYLGVWLDRCLRWSKHINVIIEKANKHLNLLKVLAGSSWGLHPKHLRHIYIALIRSRLDYSCFLYDCSARCHLYKINKVQNQALRIIGGFIKSTPIHVMESELCVPPPHLRRKYLAYKFCLKSKSILNSAITRLLSELHSFRNNYYWRNKTMPLLVSVYDEVKEEHVANSDPLKMFTLRMWVTNFDVNELIISSLYCITKSKKSYENSSLNQSIIDELHLKYEDWLPIFTDGSKNQNGQGAAFYVPNTPMPNHDNCFKIDEKVCIMTLELVAISEALSYVRNADVHRKVVILTDSKSSLQHIARCASGCRGASIAYVILCKVDELKERGVLLRLQWVPSHTGLRGNEEADILAKFATTSGKQMNIIPDYSEFMPKYKQICFENWKEYFNKRSLEKGIWYKTIQCQPLHISWCANTDLNRKLIVIAHRLRSGHIPCNKFNFMMRKTDSPNCVDCGVCEDVYHLLLECVRFQSGRTWLANAFKLNRLDVGTFNVILSSPNSKVAKCLFELMASK